MSASQPRFIQIDESGYFKMEDLRVADAESGRVWLSLIRQEGMKVLTTIDGRDVIVEAFDEPYVAVNVTRDGADWILNLPYGHSEKFDLAALSVDEWDRFHGRTQRGIPFVFSRAAQSTFFNLVDEFDDDSITVSRKTIQVSPWLQANTDAENSAWWSEFYKKNEPRWDLGGPHPALAQYVPGLKLQRSRVLILGAGRGHDAAWFAKAGHIVTAVDYSEDAIAQAKERYGSIANLNFVKTDAFNLPSSMDASFDLIFEHTMYCAIEPSRRNDLVKSWRRALVDTGHLMGVFFASDKPFGPPWGGSEWELRARLTKKFLPLYWQRLRIDHGQRLGAEAFLYLQKLTAL